MEDGLVNHVRQKRIGVDNIVATNITAYIQDIVEACVAWKQTSFNHIVSSCLHVIARVINEGDLVTRVNQDGFSVRLLTTEYRRNHPQEQINTYLLFDAAEYQRRVADLVIVEIIRSKLHEAYGDKWDKETVRSMILETIEGVIVEYGTPNEICLKHNKVKKYTLQLSSGKTYTLEQTDENIKKISQWMADDVIETLHSCEPTLESVFLEMTGRELS